MRARGVPSRPGRKAAEITMSSDFGQERSVQQVQVEEAGDQGVDPVVEVVEEVAEALAVEQRGDAEEEADVLAQQRPVLEADAQVDADEAVDVAVEGETLEHVGR